MYLQVLHHLVESQLVECHGWKSIVHIPSPNLTPTPLINSNITGIVKNLFVLSASYFQLSVYYKSYRPVLTPVDNLQRVLRLPIFNKTRLVAFHSQCNKETSITGFYQKEKSESGYDLNSLLTITNNDGC
jgi:hypothetical protein